MSVKLNILPGQVFGRLTVVKEIERHNKRRYFELLCSCGNHTIVSLSSLSAGATKSCGCLMLVTGKTHGLSKHPLYSVWDGMKQRCTNNRTIGYRNYGGRGIAVCESWNVFENFYNDVKDDYVYGLTLERKDNSKNYTKENCCWVTPAEQSRNMRSNRWISLNDAEPICLKDAAKILGFAFTTVSLWLEKKNPAQFGNITIREIV